MAQALELSLIILILGIQIFTLRSSHSLRPQKTPGARMIIDTCVLMDGRIVDVVQSGFAPGELIVPQFILRELQQLADGRDSHKRLRARHGLDVVRQLQASTFCSVTIDQTDFPSISATDDKLVALAKKHGVRLCTTDFNLNKVASIEGVMVLNINELSHNLRSAALPGEVVSVKIIQKGNSKNQGVGYLDDGTMVVVEDGMKHINRTINAEITRIHQTVAGKMLFANSTRSPRTV